MVGRHMKQENNISIDSVTIIVILNYSGFIYNYFFLPNINLRIQNEFL